MRNYGKENSYEDFRSHPQQWHRDDRTFKHNVNSLAKQQCTYEEGGSEVIIQGNLPNGDGFGIAKYRIEGDNYVLIQTY